MIFGAMPPAESHNDRIEELEAKVEGLTALLRQMAEDKASLDRALQLEQQRHESLVARVPWIVVRFDRELRYVDTNDAYKSLVGEQDLLGRALGTASEWAAWDEAVREFHADRSVASKEVELNLDVQGAPLSLFVCFSRTRIDEHITAVGVDQSDRKRALDAAEHEARRADAANQAKSDFLAVMSHEIRTPLSGVLGLVELLRDTPLSDEQVELMKALKSSGACLHSLIDDILDLTKLDSGAIEFERIAFEPFEILEGVAKLFQARASIKGLHIEIEADEGSKVPAVGDPNRLRQVLSNLVSNAIKFTTKGGITLRMRRGSDERRDHLEFEVEDTGIGIRPKQARCLFAPFIQADRSTSREFGGTGLGLAISKRLVEGMGGTIAIEQGRSSGALLRFDVLGPTIEEARSPREGASENALAPLEAELRQHNLRVLVAEDNSVNQLVVRSFLQKFGCSITLVSDGREAVEAMSPGEAFDVVLMDIDMPVLDGLAATKEIRALGGRCADLPILAMTANVVPEDRAACFEAGMNGWLGKPFDRAGIARALVDIARDRG